MMLQDKQLTCLMLSVLERKKRIQNQRFEEIATLLRALR